MSPACMTGLFHVSAIITSSFPSINSLRVLCLLGPVFGNVIHHLDCNMNSIANERGSSEEKCKRKGERKEWQLLEQWKILSDLVLLTRTPVPQTHVSWQSLPRVRLRDLANPSSSPCASVDRMYRNFPPPGCFQSENAHSQRPLVGTNCPDFQGCTQ